MMAPPPIPTLTITNGFARLTLSSATSPAQLVMLKEGNDVNEDFLIRFLAQKTIQKLTACIFLDDFYRADVVLAGGDGGGGIPFGFSFNANRRRLLQGSIYVWQA